MNNQRNKEVPMPATGLFRFSIDRGGTFTDVYAEVPSIHGKPGFRTIKLLSEDPTNPK
ncbi:MAG: hypothetical protein D3907_15740, partial [Candidatus Electrothrix sp. AUS3]|nr:hypothetical protein [Candidatus Electrothrix gigas]